MNIPYIVVVDDNPADIELLRIALNQQNEAYEMVALMDGEEAIKFMKQYSTSSEESRPCVILLDFHLPKHDGVEVLAAVKSETALKHVNVVMLTSGGVRPQEQAEVEKMGAIFRLKPRQLSEVLSLAKDVLELCKEHTAVSALSTV